MPEPGYKELQDVCKEIALKAMLDADFRALCVSDGKAVLENRLGHGKRTLGFVFLEEDEGERVQRGLGYLLPPFLPLSWLDHQRIKRE